MSAITYCRIKWVLKNLYRDSIVDDTGIFKTNATPLYANGICLAKFMFEFSPTQDDYYTLKLDRIKYPAYMKMKFDMYIHCEDLTSHFKRIEGEDFDEWKIPKEILLKKFSGDEAYTLTINILFNMQETSKDKSVLKVPSLQSLSAQIVKKTATEETALKLLHLAVIYQAKELEEGCLSLIMLHYEDLKETENWKGLTSLLTNKIMDALYNTNCIEQQTTLEYQDNWSEFSNEMELEELQEMIHELEFHSSDEDANYDGDMEAFA